MTKPRFFSIAGNIILSLVAVFLFGILPENAFGQIIVNDGNGLGEFGAYGTSVNTNFVTGLNEPQGIATDGTNLFVANFGAGTIGEYTLAGDVVNTNLISGVLEAEGIAISGTNLFVATYNGTIGEYTILLAEDTEDDIFMMKMACRRAGFPHALQVVTNGEKAIQYLAGEDQFTDRMTHPLPAVVFLDINMPRLNGHEVLKWIRGQEAFAQLPVVMLTSSRLSRDIDRAYSLGVTSYVQKKGDLGEFGQAVRVILKYWLELNILPNPPKVFQYLTSASLVEAR